MPRQIRHDAGINKRVNSVGPAVTSLNPTFQSSPGRGQRDVSREFSHLTSPSLRSLPLSAQLVSMATVPLNEARCVAAALQVVCLYGGLKEVGGGEISTSSWGASDNWSACRLPEKGTQTLVFQFSACCYALLISRAPFQIALHAAFISEMACLVGLPRTQAWRPVAAVECHNSDINKTDWKLMGELGLVERT